MTWPLADPKCTRFVTRTSYNAQAAATFAAEVIGHTIAAHALLSDLVLGVALQLPMMLYNHAGQWWRQEHSFSSELAICLLINGLAFHMQSVMAYAVMGLISPVTQSVANTAKRAIVIVGCAIALGESLEPIKLIGCTVCIGGVLLYSLVK